MNMFARFDENPAMTLQDVKETKRYGRTHAWTHGRTQRQRENSIPSTNKVCGGIIIKHIQRDFHSVVWVMLKGGTWGGRGQIL